MKKLLEAIKENKAYIFPWVILATLTVIMAFGLTYAYFDFVVDSESESSMKVTATDLHVDITNPVVNLNTLIPIYDDYKDTQANTFTFSMSNTSRKLNGCVDLYLTFNSISEGLKSENIKWELINTTTGVITSGDFSDIKDNRILLKENVDIGLSTTYDYKLLIWYSFSVTENQTPVTGNMSAKLTSIAYGGACATNQVTTYTASSSSSSNTFTAPKEGYYRIEVDKPYGSGTIINRKVRQISGEIFLAKNEKLYITMSTTVATPTNIMCYINENTGLCDASSGQNADNSRIMYASSTSSFISGYAGVNAPVYVNSNIDLSNNTLHPTGKFFLNGNTNIKSGLLGTVKTVITYLGKYEDRTNTALNNVRYIKDCVNGNTVDSTNAWVEIQAIKNGVNIAYNKTVTGTSAQYSSTLSYSKIVDGRIDNFGTDYGYGRSTSAGNQCVTVDLGRSYDLDEIAVWHYYSDGRTYNNNITSVSSNNSSWTEVINKTAAESENGKRVNAYASKQSISPTTIIRTNAVGGTLSELTVGDIVTVSIGSAVKEDFYIISTDEDETALLAKYNLYVGNVYSDNGTTLVKKLTPSDPGYGMQSSEAKGQNSSGVTVATVPFSKTNYWHDSSSNDAYEDYGTYTNCENNIYDSNFSFTDDWTDNEYSAAYYIERYVKSLGIDGYGRMLTYGERIVLNSSIPSNGSSYWMSTAYNSSTVYGVTYINSLSNLSYSNSSVRGVRPVIVVPTSDVKTSTYNISN